MIRAASQTHTGVLMRSLARFCPAILCVATLTAAAAEAQYPVQSPEFPVNAVTTGNQRDPDVAVMGQTGKMILVWASGSPSKVTGRIFNEQGAPLSSEFVINNYTGDQYAARVAADLAGNFVVVWSDPGRNDGNIFFERRNENNVPLNTAVPVETYMTGFQQNPAVAVAAGGEFVIVWHSYSGIDPSESGVFGQRFNASGAKVGGEFQINQYTTGYQRNPRVAILVSGEFIVTWSSEQDEQSGAVMARAYATDGTPIGGEFQVNTTELGAQYQPDVALDPFGQAIVVWQSFLQDGDGPGIYGQRLDLGGTKLGPEFNVNTYTTGTQRNPHVAAGPEGDFTVVWESFGNEGDPNSEAVVAQHFAGHGRRDQVETVLNATTSGHQQLPHITANAQLGQFVAVWESAGQDGDGYGVFGRLGELPRGAPADVDAVASGGSSNLNGLLEPGERVVVRPAYRNNTGDPLPLTGAATLGGPPGGTYTLHDAAADYGPISAGATGSCGGTENCYEATVGGARPVAHWDAALDETLSLDSRTHRWALHVGGSFADVPQNAFYPFIENLFHNGVTGGCAGGGYCPANNVTRGQMAVFLLKAQWGAAFLPPPATGTAFPDVPADNPFARWIEELVREGITAGCGNGNYCPNNPVTRAQMAIFLLKTKYGAAYVPPDGVGIFGDVLGCPNPTCNFIEDLYNQQVTGGCQATPLLYCPASSVLRQQMAVFLVKNFLLQLYGN